MQYAACKPYAYHNNEVHALVRVKHACYACGPKMMQSAQDNGTPRWWCFSVVGYEACLYRP